MNHLRQRLASLAIATTLLAPVGLLLPTPAVLAADDGLDVRTTARYVVVPSSGVVRVTVDIAVTNRTPTTTRGNVVTSYFFDRLPIPVQDEASRLRVTEGGRRLQVSTAERTGFDQVTIRLSNRLQYRQTDRLRVTYDLPGGKPRSASDIRVGKAFATFYLWALGDRGNVRVEIPSGFDVETYGDSINKSRSGGRTILSATVNQTDSWTVGVYASNEANLTDRRLALEGGEAVVIKAWPEDAEWSERVGGLLSEALPELEELLGLSWPVFGDLEVSEVHTPLLEGYAGIYDPSTDEIVITEDLDDLVIVHEASHAWFNGGLFAERWANEGMADLYAALTLERLGQDRERAPTIDSGGAEAFKLLDWGPPESIDDDATAAREDFGYGASWAVMERLHREIGDDGMRRVIQAADARSNPYAGDGEPETIGGIVTWRRLLDLFEEVGGSSTAEDLFRDWVLGAGAALDLRARTDARGAYVALAAAGDGWHVPAGIRRAMADWRFDDATDQMEHAYAVLATRQLLATEAAAAGLTVPAGVEDLYEHTQGSFDKAQDLADEQLAALRAVVAAGSTVAAPRETLTQIGLWDVVQPEVQLAAARTAWSAGDLDAATGSAAAAEATLALAPETGAQRALIAGGGAAGGVLALGAGAVLLLRRRRRRHRGAIEVGAIDEAALASPALAAAAAADGETIVIPRPAAEGSAGSGPEGGYATLPPHPTAAEPTPSAGTEHPPDSP